MSEYIEISEGLSIRIDEIEAVGRRDEFTSVVHTHHNSYDSTFPYEVLLGLIQRPDSKKEELNIIKSLGVPAW